MAATHWLHIYCANSQKVTFCDFAWLLTLKKSLHQHGPNFHFFRNASSSTEIKLNEVKTPWVLVGASNSGNSMIAYLLRQLTKSNILWFCAWPLTLKNPCANMDLNLFFQKCKQQYWDKLNEVKAPWVLVGAASSKHIKSASRTAWTFIWPLIYCALALRKCLENY